MPRRSGVLGMRAIGVSVVTPQGEDGAAGFLALSATHVNTPTRHRCWSRSTTAHMRCRLCCAAVILRSINCRAANRRWRIPLAAAARSRATIVSSRAAGEHWRRARRFSDAVGAIDCTLEETFRRHNTTIAIGRVAAFHLSERSDALLFYRGQYRQDLSALFYD